MLVAVRYRRGGASARRGLMLVGVCLTWLSYGLIQLTQDGPFPTGTPLNYALDGLAVVLLFAGLYAMYRWWRRRGSEADG